MGNSNTKKILFPASCKDRVMAKVRVLPLYFITSCKPVQKIICLNMIFSVFYILSKYEN